MNKIIVVLSIALAAAVIYGGLAATGVLTGINGGSNTLSQQALTTAERSGLRGEVHLILQDKDGNIKYETKFHNLITDAGEDIIQKVFSGGIASGTATADTVCVGTGTTAAAENGAGSALVTATSGGSTPATCKEDASVTIGTQTGSTAQTVDVDATFTGGTDFAADTAVAEAVLADTVPASNAAPAAANTFSRQTFTAITVASGDSLTIKWTITVSE